MESVDVTRAVLMVLAQEYPSSVGTPTLERLVSCERDALQRHLRLLEATGAVYARESAGDGREVVAATITESALGVLRKHPKAFARGGWSHERHAPAPGIES